MHRPFLIALLLLLPPHGPAAADSGRILYRPAQTFRGWGMSLAWEANDLYGGGRQPAQIRDPQVQAQYMDLLFGDPAARLTLGFTVARYNIGGGDNPAHTHMRADAQMEGYETAADSGFDWTRDAPQRRMLHEAKARGASLFEAFSVSPPYWMTVSGCSSGAATSPPDNLRPEMRERFVNDLASVVAHFRDVEGIRFESVEPFNEPDLGWGAGGRQEGYSASPASQNAIIPMLAARLKRDGAATFVSGVDSNNVGAAGTVARLEPAALAALGRLNTHDYHAGPRFFSPKQYGLLAQKLGKPVWMSELGCCFPGQGDKTDMWGALFMADAVRVDLRDLRAEAWVLWQPDWNVIAFDPAGGAPVLKKQYYALLQYTRFIRPGFEIISAGGAYNTLAAYSRASRRLVLVSTGWDAPAPADLDLSAFAPLPASVAVYRTTAEREVNLQHSSLALTADGHLVDRLPVRSVTTYVVDGVAPLPAPPSGGVEGVHQIVSAATRLCFNISGDSSRSGDRIIVYPCGGFTDMDFNFEDRKGGFYSIRSVNGPEGAAGLCLNVALAAASPGDGRTPGGAGNLIQWSCAGRLPLDNELFQVIAAGAGRVRLRVKGSGLCLEDPGRGGLIRQNICSESSLSQQFELAG